MPWKETVIMNEKVKFIAAYLDKGAESFRSLCERFSISCKTGYKYVARYQAEGVDGLKEHSRAPHTVHRIMAYQEEAILEIKHRYPSWGGKKIVNFLHQEYKEQDWPVKSTIDALLKQNDLVRPAKRKRVVQPYTKPLILCQKPNDTWSIDFKGQFRLGNQTLCYPLTITDNFSRYILAIQCASRISTNMTQNALQKLFVVFGLPWVIRSDNGTPFASHGLAGLSRLSVWLIKLGIIPERIRKGHPEENGRHERMHLTLKNETTFPPCSTLEEQQKCFDGFRQSFNEERPHEGIAFQRPVWLYQSSSRSFPKKLSTIEYDDSFLIKRRIRDNGTMKWSGKEIFISETLVRENIGFKPHNEEEWVLYFSFLPIGIFNENTGKVRRIET